MLERTNRVYVVGELVEIKDYKKGVYNNDKEYIATTVVIKSIVDGKELLIEGRSFVNKLKKDGTVSKNYTALEGLNDMLNRRVVLTNAEIEGDRFWSDRTNQLVNSTRINFNTIKLASKENDIATFEFGGFVTRPLQEIVDENGNVKYYQITFGQANYKEDNMFEAIFTVEADNINAARAIEQIYEAGVTAVISGNYRSIITCVEKTTDVAFGDPIVKKYYNSDRKFIITSGGEAITGAENGEYTEEVIAKLVAAYNESGKQIQEKALSKTTSSTDSKTVAPKPKAKNSSLAGLI